MYYIRTEENLDTKKEVLAIIDEVLSLNGRATAFDMQTPLLGAVPELESMAVVGLITTMEERLGCFDPERKFKLPTCTLRR